MPAPVVQHCPVCNTKYDVGIYVSGQRVKCRRCGNKFVVQRNDTFVGAPGGPLAALLAGLGLMAGATAAGTLLAITAIWLVNGLVWFARLHYRLLKPAIEPQAQGRA